MATLAFNHAEIAARELKPEFLELHGISRAAVEAHYKLYQGYVAKRNEILGKLAEADLAARTRSTGSSARSRSISASRSAASRTTRSTSSTWAAAAAIPTARWASRPARLRRRRDVARRPQGDGHGRPRLGLDGLRLGRGPPLQHVGDAQNTFPLWNATPLWRSTSTSTPTSSTTRPTAGRTSTPFSTTSTGAS